MSDKVVIDGELNLRSQLDGDPNVELIMRSFRFEHGEITADSNAATSRNLTINFAEQHDDKPIYVVIADTSEDTEYNVMTFTYSNFYLALGVSIPVPYVGTENMGSCVVTQYHTNGDNYPLMGYSQTFITDPLVTNTFIKAGAIMPRPVTWTEGHVYKWLAVWR